VKNSLALILLLLSLQAELRPARVGYIEFYGSAGLDVNRVRASLPIREGQTFPSVLALDAVRPQSPKRCGA
jgi:hypothetical protein